MLCVTVNTLLCRFALVSCLGVGLLVHFQCEMVGSGLNYGMCSSNQFKICIKTFNFNASDSCLNVRLLVHFLLLTACVYFKLFSFQGSLCLGFHRWLEYLPYVASEFNL